MSPPRPESLTCWNTPKGVVSSEFDCSTFLTVPPFFQSYTGHRRDTIHRSVPAQASALQVPAALRHRWSMTRRELHRLVDKLPDEAVIHGDAPTA